MTDRPSDIPPAAPRGRLVRRTDDKLIAGVASGVAAQLGVEPVLVRIGFIVLTFFGGLGALLYVLGWLLIPAAGHEESIALAAARRPAGAASYLAMAMVILAIGIIASAFSRPGVVWAIALIAFGAYLFQQRQEQPRPAPPVGPPPPAGPPPAPAGAEPPAAPPGGPPPAPGAPAGPGEPGPPAAPAAWGASTATTEPLAWERPAATTEPLAWERPAPAAPPAAWGAPVPRTRRRRAFLGPLTVGLALVVSGLAVMLDNLGVLEMTLGRVLALFLAVVGLGLLVGAWWGRAWGLIPLGLLLIPLVAAASLADSEPLTGGFGERLWQPRTAAEVRPAYRLAGGELIVDLGRVRFRPGATTVEASLAGGRLLVVVPDDVAAEVRGRAGAGVLDLFGSGEDRWGTQVDSTVAAPPTKPPKAGAAPTVRLDAHVGYGLVEVRRASDPRPLTQVGSTGPVPPPTTLAPEVTP
jgi:phage shock protein PspC (stress-responsive transcriptional regulator)